MFTIKRVMTVLVYAVLAATGYCQGQGLYYVAVNGKDAWSGTLPAPNAAGNDGPKASLAAARDASRVMAGLERRIVLGEGRFFQDQPLQLDSRDSGLVIAGAGVDKTIVYGGRRIEGWRQAGEHFWRAELPKDLPDWSFRVLLVNDQLQARARFPEEGYLEHETEFKVRWMSTAGGGWERKPTEKECIQLQYRQGDIPATLAVANAEVTVCHMWSESTVLLAGHDPATRILTFASRTEYPVGSYGVHRYALWNIREGMTRPGQWYLDRTERAVYYWPAEGVDMATAMIVAPTVESIFDVQGTAKERVNGLSISGMTMSATHAPMRPAGFGAASWPGAVQLTYADKVLVDAIAVCNAGGWGVREWNGQGLVVSNSLFHHLGGGGIRFGSAERIDNNRIYHIGLVSASAIALSGRCEKALIRRNVIHDTPYSGMSVGGVSTIIEENLLYRCMQVHRDGAAIYVSSSTDCIIRRNLARDMVQIGQGYGVSAYYLDEKCRNCVVSENVAINIPHPSQNHMTLNCELRDNVFISEGDMKIAFSRCNGHVVSGNTFHIGGKLNVTEPDAISTWADNVIFVRNETEGRIMAEVPQPEKAVRDKPRYFRPQNHDSVPVVDGKLGDGEWPNGGLAFNERINQRGVRGAPTSVKILADDEFLYFFSNIVTMFPEQRKLGTTWGVDEGVELVLESRDGDKRHCYVLRGFSDGTLQSLTLAGVTQEQAEAFRSGVQYAAGVDRLVWRSEWRVPTKALGLTPGEKTTLRFNMTAYRSEDDVFAQLAGTMGETWDLERGAVLMLNWDAPAAQAAKDTPLVPALTGAIAADWKGLALELAQTPAGVPLSATPAQALLARSGDTLLVRVVVPTAQVTKGATWRQDDGAEVCLAGKTADGKAVVWVIRGYANGQLELSDEAGAPPAAGDALRPQLQFQATVNAGNWQAEWRLPIAALGLDSTKPVPFNIGVFRQQDRQWINWIGTGGATWKLANAGAIRLQ